MSVMASWYFQKMAENASKVTDLADKWGVEWRKRLKDDWAQMEAVLDEICQRILDSTLSPCGDLGAPPPLEHSSKPSGSQPQGHKPSEAAWGAGGSQPQEQKASETAWGASGSQPGEAAWSAGGSKVEERKPNKSTWRGKNFQ